MQTFRKMQIIFRAFRDHALVIAYAVPFPGWFGIWYGLISHALKQFLQYQSHFFHNWTTNG
jgi:hypothetical protein